MMRVINKRFETITEYDLEKGKLVKVKLHRKDGTAEDVMMYIPNSTVRPVPNSVKIRQLKQQLSATDYKVVKCAECQLLGEDMPYDVAALHAERQALRDQINLLEQEARR